MFWNGIKDSQSGMWVFKKSIFDNKKMRPTNDGMPLSEEIKILARKHIGKKKAVEMDEMKVDLKVVLLEKKRADLKVSLLVVWMVVQWAEK